MHKSKKDNFGNGKEIVDTKLGDEFETRFRLKQFHIVREPSKGASLRLKELWEYRELAYFLLWRNIIVRYKQTAFGVTWALLQPFLIMVVFSIFFGKLAKIPSDGIPYPLFTFAAILPWQLFSRSITLSSNSLIQHSNLITKVYFPRILLPAAAVLSSLVDFAIAFVILIGMMFYYGITPTIWITLLPLFILLALITTLAISLWLSAINVTYRDVRYIVPFLIQFWMFITPIVYPTSLIPEKWQIIYALNPMTGVVEGFRWALLGKQMEIGILLVVSITVTIIAFISSLYYFRYAERSFADII